MPVAGGLSVSMTAAPAGEGAEPQRLAFEFRGHGSEFFRIWIVNISLTILTLGIYSAWARVRTKRYFYGNTYLGGHPFDYHASPLRILVGRIIAVLILLLYNLTAAINPGFAILWLLAFVLALPWLINSSLRFNARYTSYRNVRFNFHGTYGLAFLAHIGWPIIGGITLGTLIPLARRARDYYNINNHTYGGAPFHTEYKGWRIYIAYLIGVALVIALYVGVMMLVFGMYDATHPAPVPVADTGPNHLKLPDTTPPQLPWWYYAIGYLVLAGVTVIWLSIRHIVDTMVFNLGIGNATLDGKHNLQSKLFPPTVAWIKITNILLTLVTLGLFYPFARVRFARYEARRLGLAAASDLSEFTSETIGNTNAVGEEIGSVFDVDIGL